MGTTRGTNLDIIELLKLTFERGASDLHLTVGIPPTLRIDGELTPTEYDPLTPADTHRLMYSLMDGRRQKIFEEENELDFSFSLSGYGRFRINVFKQRGNVASALRTIPTKILGVEELGLPPILLEFCKQPRGLFLVTGPTGHGKSTTLAAMIDYINGTRRQHIITIEDPIEYAHTHKSCIVNQREVFADTHSFAEALKRALREDPDVILVGEMRDFETISTAITAAETGHIVFATLHTNSAAEAIDRIIDVFPPHQQPQVRIQLANSLIGIATQQLLVRMGGKGRVPAVEVLVATPAIRNLIREGKTFQIFSAMQTGARYGMQTMDQALKDLYERRLISYEDALNRCHDREEFLRMLGEGAPTPSARITPRRQKIGSR